MQYRILLLGFLAFSLNAFARPMIVPTFVGGIDHQAAKACKIQIQRSSCQLKNLLLNYQQCIKKVLMQNKPICQQSLKFFQLTGGGIFQKIHRYKNIDIIRADYVYIADQGTGYFLVMKSGQFLAIPLNISKKTLKTAPGYLAIAKRYHRAGAWQITSFPTSLSFRKFYRLVFTQELKDGCNACANVGTAKVAYDFSNDGKQFYGIKVLQLIPKPLTPQH